MLVRTCLCSGPSRLINDWHSEQDTVSERLRRRTPNPLGFARRGSNLGVASADGRFIFVAFANQLETSTVLWAPAIAQLVEHLTVDNCSNQIVPGSITSLMNNKLNEHPNAKVTTSAIV